MQTIYDWMTLIAFSGLAVLFLQRSTATTLTDKVWHYIPPALGCAVSNQLGNNGYVLAAIAVLAASIVYVFIVLKPLAQNR